MTRDEPKLEAMACRACAYRLDGVTSRRCPECGSPFDPTDPTTFAVVLDDPVRVVSTNDRGRAADLLSYLLAHGIQVVEHTTDRGVIEAARIELWVNRRDRDRARELIGLRPPPAADLGPEWSCAACGEEVPDNFDVCWSCGQERDPG